MAGEKIARSKRHLTEAQEYVSKCEADTSPDVRGKLVDIAKRAEQALATQDRVSTLLADVKRASESFYRHFKQQIENEAEPDTAQAIYSILESPELLQAMIAARKRPEHEDKTLPQLVALITDKSEPPVAPAERSSAAPQGNEPSQPGPKGNAIHADYSPIFNELEALTEELLRQNPLPPPTRDDLVTLLREKADLVEKVTLKDATPDVMEVASHPTAG